jgi:hypothetical protein
MTEVLHGIIHGKTILLEQDPGIGDGRTVEVVLRPVSPVASWGDGLRRCAGALASDPEMDGFLEEIQHERKLDNPQELPE